MKSPLEKLSQNGMQARYSRIEVSLTKDGKLSASEKLSGNSSILETCFSHPNCFLHC